MTLTTYYPAPYGAYVAMLTTNQTLLARDGGNVGIGIKRPQAKLEVVGTAAATNLQVNGTAVEDTSCSPNGLIARNDAGGLLSCQSLVWKKAMGSSNGAYSFRIPGDAYGDMYYGTGTYDSVTGKFSGTLICDPNATTPPTSLCTVYCGSADHHVWCGSNTDCAWRKAGTGGYWGSGIADSGCNNYGAFVWVFSLDVRNVVQKM